MLLFYFINLKKSCLKPEIWLIRGVPLSNVGRSENNKSNLFFALELQLWDFSKSRLFQITNLMHNSFIFQQYVCYTTLLNMFRAARCLKHVEDRSVTYILLKNKRIVH